MSQGFSLPNPSEDKRKLAAEPKSTPVKWYEEVFHFLVADSRYIATQRFSVSITTIIGRISDLQDNNARRQQDWKTKALL